MKLPWQGHIVDHIVSMTCLDAWAWTKESSDLPLPLYYWFFFFRQYSDVQKLLYTICVNSIDAIHNTYMLTHIFDSFFLTIEDWFDLRKKICICVNSTVFNSIDYWPNQTQYIHVLTHIFDASFLTIRLILSQKKKDLKIEWKYLGVFQWYLS